VLWRAWTTCDLSFFGSSSCNICLLPAGFSQIRYKTPSFRHVALRQINFSVFAVRYTVGQGGRVPSLFHLTTGPISGSCSCGSNKSVWVHGNFFARSAGTTETVATIELPSTLGSLLALSASLWLFSLFSIICIAMIPSRLVLNSEVILLEMFQPSSNLACWETKGKQQAKGCVVCP